MTITIIGSGKVGASAALHCSLRELDHDVLLLDIVNGLPQGEAMDINHLLSEKGIDTQVRGSNNFEDMKKSEIVVLVAGIGRKPGMTRMDLLKTNAGIIKDISQKIASYANDCFLIVVTNPLDPMTYLSLKVTGFDKQRVMGMGGMLDLSRFKSFIQESVGVSRESINAMVISEHGENMLPLIRYSSISGIPLTKFVTKEESEKIFENTKKVAAEVIALKGATVYAPGNAVSTMVESIIKDKKQIIPVSAYLNGEYNTNDVCIGVPVILDKSGINKIIELDLDENEENMFNKGIESVREAIKSFSI